MKNCHEKESDDRKRNKKGRGAGEKSDTISFPGIGGEKLEKPKVIFDNRNSDNR